MSFSTVGYILIFECYKTYFLHWLLFCDDGMKIVSQQYSNIYVSNSRQRCS